MNVKQLESKPWQLRESEYRKTLIEKGALRKSRIDEIREQNREQFRDDCRAFLWCLGELLGVAALFAVFVALTVLIWGALQ